MKTIESIVEGCLVLKPASEWIKEAIMITDPVPLWENLWFEGEIACLFSDSNMGKSIYAVQIADQISQQQPVIYFDFELSYKQFQLRYADGDNSPRMFSENFIRCEIDPIRITEAVMYTDLSEHMVDAARRVGANVLIIDNLTFMCNDSENGLAAHDFMVRLTELKKAFGLSILVLAHTPKRDSSLPISQNDLAGSKRLFNFFDSVFAIGKSVQGEDMRYIKQLKARLCPITYGADNVLTARIVKQGPMLMFEHMGTAKEKAHIENRRSSISPDKQQRILDLRKDNCTIRDIAEQTGVPRSTVSDFLHSLEY